MWRRRLVLLLLLLVVFIVANRQRTARRQAMIDELRLEVGGPGRGRGPRQPERPFPSIDVYNAIRPQGDAAFLTFTRLTHAQFLDLLIELRPPILANRRVRMNAPDPTGQQRATKMTPENRLLMAIKFLVQGTSEEALAVEFGVHPAVVSEDLRHVIFALVTGLSYEVQWPNAEQRQQLRDIMGAQFVNAFGTIDGTFTPTFRRGGDYSGHRHAFVRSHQICADALGFIVHVVAAQIGARHDAYNYQRSGIEELLRASGASLLADDGYEGCSQLRLSASADDIPDAALRDIYNEQHKSRRSRVEQFIGLLKSLFRVVAQRWERQDRRFLAVCVLASCMLYNRRKRLNP